jgi:diaminohydroxyphosphoribosylaminopyrimidine deaminase/5-amino-6-(5-phosphoribosylamino)uracil reductase
VRGRGFSFLRQHRVAVEVGLEAARSVALNDPFFTLMLEQRPFVIPQGGGGLDGRIAEAPGKRTALTSSAANRHAHRFRAEVDAVGVGVGTIRVDDPELTVRGIFRERPLVRVIFDRRLRTPPDARVLSTCDSGPVIIVTTDAFCGATTCVGRSKRAVPEIRVADAGALRPRSGRLAGEIGSLLLEGGGAARGGLEGRRRRGAVVRDAERALGTRGGVVAGQQFSVADLRERRVEPLGPDVLIEGYVHRSR